MVLTLNIYACCEFMCNRSHRHTSRYANVDSWFYRVGHQGGVGHLSILIRSKVHNNQNNFTVLEILNFTDFNQNILVKIFWKG